MKRAQKNTQQAAPPVIVPTRSEAPDEPLVAAAAPVVDPNAPTQVDASVFLAARLREVTAEAANLRTLVADLQAELARMKASAAQAEIDRLDQVYNVGSGTILQKREDGTYWRIPREAIQS
jgi:hypothetical protein